MSELLYTIKDVAKMANVSPGTASRAINGKGYVNKKTKMRVLKAAEELKYRPNFNAKSLVTKKSNIIALIIPSIDNSYYAPLVKGAQENAEQNGFHLVCCTADNVPERNIDLLKTFYDIRVDGVLLCVEESEKSEEYSKYLMSMKKNGMPIVMTGPRYGISGIDIIKAENVNSCLNAVEYLIESGHKEIAFIGGTKDTIVEKERISGYKQALISHDLEINNNFIYEGAFTYDSGYELMNRLLSSSHIPSAVFAANDIIAIGALNAIIDKGLNVPNDISLVGFDDIAMASMVRPMLTTVAQPNYEIGKAATGLLLERISGEAPPMARLVTLETTLKVRESTIRNEK